jgi:hypothetical protein
MHLRQKIATATGAAVFAVALVGCTGQQTASSSSAETTSTTASTLVALGAVPTVPNDLAANSAHHSLQVPGESFTLTVDYYLTDYDATAWQTLQPKNVHLSVHLAPTSAESPEVLMGSFRGVTTLLAAMPGLDGLPIAETNDVPQAIPGYLINANYPYDNVLTIEGFSTPLADRWTLLAGAQPLTESGLAAAGVYANRMTFSYRILVKNNGDSGYHQRIVQDTVTVTQAAPPTAETPAASTAATTG